MSTSNFSNKLYKASTNRKFKKSLLVIAGISLACIIFFYFYMVGRAQGIDDTEASTEYQYPMEEVTAEDIENSFFTNMGNAVQLSLSYAKSGVNHTVSSIKSAFGGDDEIQTYADAVKQNVKTGVQYATDGDPNTLPMPGIDVSNLSSSAKNVASSTGSKVKNGAVSLTKAYILFWKNLADNTDSDLSPIINNLNNTGSDDNSIENEESNSSDSTDSEYAIDSSESCESIESDCTSDNGTETVNTEH